MEADRPEGGLTRESATTEEYLAAVTIGPREPLNGTIHLAAHDPVWASSFLLLAGRIRAALAEKVLLLEHVGSTSVPGLAAKPVIDIVLAVSDCADESAYVPLLENHGFALTLREPDWFEHRLLRSGDVDSNLHVFSIECEEINRMMVFRDWLRTHEEERRRYEDVKRELASRTWRHVQNCADAKSGVVREMLARAATPPGHASEA